MVVGALIGLVIGVALSLYVAVVDMRKRKDGVRSRAQYRGSLVIVPVLLAALGALIGAALSSL